MKIVDEPEESVRIQREAVAADQEQGVEESQASEHNPLETASEATSMLHDWIGNSMVTAALQGGGGFDDAVAAHLGSAVAGFEPTGGLGSNRSMMRAMRRSRREGEVSMPQITLGGGKALAPEVLLRFEEAMGHEFSHVRIHTDGMAQAKASEVNAHAFAVGNHIFFGSGAFQPGTPDGDRLLAHELTHVIQHDEHRVGRLPEGRDVSRPTDSTEVEAYANEKRVSSALDKVDQALSEHEVSTPQPMLSGQGIMELVENQSEEGVPGAVADRMHASLGTGEAAATSTTMAGTGVLSRSEDEGVEIGPGKHSGGAEEQEREVAELEINELKEPIVFIRGRVKRFVEMAESSTGSEYGIDKHMPEMLVMSEYINEHLERSERDLEQLSQSDPKEFPHEVEGLKQHLVEVYQDLSTIFPNCWDYVGPESQKMDHIAHASGVKAFLETGDGLVGAGASEAAGIDAVADKATETIEAGKQNLGGLIE